MRKSQNLLSKEQYRAKYSTRQISKTGTPHSLRTMPWSSRLKELTRLALYCLSTRRVGSTTSTWARSTATTMLLQIPSQSSIGIQSLTRPQETENQFKTRSRKQICRSISRTSRQTKSSKTFAWKISLGFYYLPETKMPKIKLRLQIDCRTWAKKYKESATTAKTFVVPLVLRSIFCTASCRSESSRP